MRKDYIPFNHEELILWGTVFLSYLSAHCYSWNVPASIYDDLQQKFTAFRSAHDTYVLPATHSPVNYDAMMEKKKIFVSAARSVAQYLAHSPYLTLPDFEALGINAPNNGYHRRHSRPMTPAFLRFETGGGRGWIHMHFRDEENRGSRKKPAGVHGLDFRTGIFKTGQEAKTVEELPDSLFAVRSPYLFDLGDRNSGDVLCVAGRWENTSGEKGPWSNIFTVVIP
jgi:hypothetical protein